MTIAAAPESLLVNGAGRCTPIEAVAPPWSCGSGHALVYPELLGEPAAMLENGFDRFLEDGVR
ncbi:hypothetical protein [Streptomyces sp. 147326]|uniref:hypothetical protein n=1 Tax=Streptomyces sp. 147326 TaxID=3074379 RepID=UPI003857383A